MSLSLFLATLRFLLFSYLFVTNFCHCYLVAISLSPFYALSCRHLFITTSLQTLIHRSFSGAFLISLPLLSYSAVSISVFPILHSIFMLAFSYRVSLSPSCQKCFVGLFRRIFIVIPLVLFSFFSVFFHTPMLALLCTHVAFAIPSVLLFRRQFLITFFLLACLLYLLFVSVFSSPSLRHHFSIILFCCNFTSFRSSALFLSHQLCRGIYLSPKLPSFVYVPLLRHHQFFDISVLLTFHNCIFVIISLPSFLSSFISQFFDCRDVFARLFISLFIAVSLLPFINAICRLDFPGATFSFLCHYFLSSLLCAICLSLFFPRIFCSHSWVPAPFRHFLLSTFSLQLHSGRFMVGISFSSYLPSCAIRSIFLPNYQFHRLFPRITLSMFLCRIFYVVSSKAFYP